MGERKLQQAENKKQKNSSLKGTLIFVFFLGFFLIFTWFSVYQIFVNRL
ncbi:cytochrome c oxidase subunit 2A [Bacillus cytotoxicus]|uniref:Cytochrome c oxidase subunit 2A n=1 Tax=Bacillus cytotoxicus TaxID=580165 RepID=A0ACC6ADX0_9BACI|nr:cytochrome c oxidase subunit 2A [Bacillus cytotoxicus]